MTEQIKTTGAMSKQMLKGIVASRDFTSLEDLDDEVESIEEDAEEDVSTSEDKG
jgi:hypothetical protein